VEVHISRLRERLGDRAWMIETVRGVGYRLRQRGE
jgi:DNA-binding response OmpR family regulator